jgi:hypothetical protein
MTRCDAPELSRRALLALGGAVLGEGVLGASLGCGGAVSLVPIGGERVPAEQIDRDPLALLPGGVVVFGDLKLASLYATPMAADVLGLLQAIVPLGAEANFDPTRDTWRVVGGAYAMQGVDFCAVVQGRFDVGAIQRAAEFRAAGPSGLPIVKSRYAEYDVFTLGNLGFVVLTPSTMLAGNEVGMRRALDRLRRGALERKVPEWMTTFANGTSAAFTVACDFGADSVLRAPGAVPAMASLPSAGLGSAPSGSPAEPILEAASGTLPFLHGLRVVRILGDFSNPGLNLACSLTYGAPETAASAAGWLRGLSTNMFASFALAFAAGLTFTPTRVETNGSQLEMTLPVDLGSARSLIGLASSYARRR